MGAESLNAQTILFSEDFAGGIPGTWTNTGTGGVWTAQNTANVSGVPIATTTSANNYAIFNSDAAGNDLIPENVDLITPSINCTANNIVLLQFEDVFAQFGTSSGTVSVSNDNGTTWTDFYVVGPGIAANNINGNPNLVQLNISSVAANQANVKVRFKYQGDWEYWWIVDDIFVYSPPANDVFIDSLYLAEYTAVPEAHTSSYTPVARVFSNSAATSTNVTVDVNIYDGNNVVVFNTTMNQASLAAYTNTTLTSATSFTPTGKDFYLAEYIVSINETDANISNDTLYTAIDVTDSTYARDYYYLTGDVNGLDGPWFVGAANDGQLGNVFTAEADAELVSAIATFGGGFAIGDQTQANLYSMVGGVPGALIASSPVLTVTQADTPVIFYEFTFPAGTNLTAGNDYFISVQQNAASAAGFGLYSATNVYTPNTSFLQINGGAWLEIASAGLGNQTFMIRANVYTPYIPQDCGDLIISEIVEGGGNSKCLELYNPTANPIDLSDYSINVYNNGGGSPNTNTPLTGIVPAMGTFVICNSNSSAAFLALADATNFNNAVNYNGNDVIELLRGSDVIDIIGEVGSAANFNLNQTLVRNEDVLVGDLDGSNAFDASVWTSYPQDYSLNLGAHYSDCNPVCHFDNVTYGTQTACVNTTNEYTQEVTVTYSNAPTTGMLNINGQTFAITSSPQTEILTGLDSDGASVDISVFFTAEPACEYIENAAFTAATYCLCPAITVNVATTDVTTCTTPDGTATANVTGGTAPYTYAWTPSTYGATQTISSLPSGSYSVVVTDDNGCLGNGSGNVANTAGVNAVVDSTSNPRCFMSTNGYIAVVASGGTAPYTYTWSDQPGVPTNNSSKNNLGDGTYSVIVTDAGGCSVTLGPITLTQPGFVSAQLVGSTNVNCNGASTGAIDMNVFGGTAPYTLTWSNSTATTEDLAGVAAGTYQISVEDDNGCTTSGPAVTITEPSAISVTANTVSDASCNAATDGTIDMSVSGGTAPYTYVWSNSTTTTEDLTAGAGNYTLTVTDDNGCSASSSQETISEPAAINITLDNSSGVSCNGANDGEFTVSATGGVNPLSYSIGGPAQITGVFQNLNGNNYVVTVTDDNACTNTLTVNIVEPAVLTVVVDSVNDITCFASGNGEIFTTISGGTAPYTNVWTNSTETTDDITNLDANDYTLSVTDANGCTATSAQSTIVEPIALSATGTTTPESTSGAADGTATVLPTGGTAPYTLLWDDANSQTTATATGLVAGSYTVSIADANGCNHSIDLEVDLGSSIKQINLNDFNVYPNPTSKNVTISFDANNSEEMKVKFFNTIGKVVLSETVFVNNAFNKTFNVSDFAAGVYFIEISNEKGKAIKKITVNK